MKKLLILSGLLFTLLNAQAQIINIPDANFKAALLAGSWDTNSDGEIQVSEAEARTDMFVDNQSISSLEGIEFFINLEHLGCGNNQLTELNLSTLTNLESLDCPNNQLTELNITNSPNLTGMDCSNNLLTIIDFSAQSFFSTLWCDNNNLTTLDFSHIDSINNFYASNNQLTSISLAGVMNHIYVNNNQLTEIDLSNISNLFTMSCENNLLTTLDVSHNPELGSLVINNNALTSLNLGNAESLGLSGDLLFDGNPDIAVICTVEDNFDEVQVLLTEYGYTDCTISTYCSFTPYGEYYVVQGQAKYDANTDGCEVSDSPIPHLQYNITSNAIYDSFISNSNGDYTLYVDSGSHVISPMLINPSYFTVSPPEITVEFPTDPNPFIEDFCIMPNGVFNDLEITIIPVDLARPGFDTNYKVLYKNKGTTPLSGNINFGFEDDVMDFVSSTPPNESGVPDLLQWPFVDLVPFESREINLTMNLNAPTDTPPLNDGDVLTFNASVASSETDETPDDNMFELNQTVVNSFDPNDKTCLEGAFITPEMVGDYVHYMIRFENTGSAEAINIVVKDHIDITKYDLSSLVPLHASHNYFANIKDDAPDHYVEFIFEAINLPFDDANNDGYVVFKIKTLDTLELNDTIENEAEIYFDFNFPIITNIAETTVQVLSVDDFEFDAHISIYPNPVQNELFIDSKNIIERISIYDVSGRLISKKSIIGSQNKTSISTENLSSSVYFIRVKTAQNEFTKKIVKD